MRDGKYVILAIDDDADILEALRLVLEAHGYEMIEAVTAEEGLRVYKANKPDLIIVDLMMEEVDAGVNFVKEVKLLGPKPPIYMLTSVGDDLNETISYSDIGVDGVFQKPVDNNTLLKVIKTKLG
jgi:DNA-binding response OmpR family regulator